MQKKTELRLTLRKGDLCAAAAVLLLAALVALLLLKSTQKTDARIAVVYRNRSVVREIDLDALSEPLTFTVDGDYEDVVTAEKGRICVQTADCPDQSCVHMGWISEPGESIVCLPNRLEIRISGEGGVDAVVR